MNYRELGWGDYLKHLFNKGTAPVEKNYPPTMRPHAVKPPSSGNPADFNESFFRQAEEPVKRPVAPAVEPAAPAAVKREVPPGTMAKGPIKGPVTTPNFRERNLPGVNDVKPNPWKNMLREGINQMATPGYFDKDRGVWVSGAHAYGEKKAGKTKENKTIEFLKRKGHSKEDAEAIVAQGADAVKEAMSAVKAPRRFDKRGYPLFFQGGKAFATSPEGVVSEAQLPEESGKSGGVYGDLSAATRGNMATAQRALDIYEQNPNLASAFVGGSTTWLPGMPGYQLKSTFDAIKGREAIETAIDMRNKAGANVLGQITAVEFEALGGTDVKLDVGAGDNNKRELRRYMALQEIAAGGLVRQSVGKVDDRQGSPTFGKVVTQEMVNREQASIFAKHGIDASNMSMMGGSNKASKSSLESLGIKRISE
jgi:hypothetical protein